MCRKYDMLPLSNVVMNVCADTEGYVFSINCETVGRAALKQEREELRK
jgi:hypothetical protein